MNAMSYGHRVIPNADQQRALPTMKRRLVEQLTLFASVLKWSLYSSVVGAVVGLSTVAFLKSLT